MIDFWETFHGTCTLMNGKENNQGKNASQR